MRLPKISAFLIVLLSLNAFPAFIPGFKQFRFYMAPAQVKEILASNGFSAADVQESYAELCQVPYFTQELLAVESKTRQFIPLSFSTNIPELMKRTERRVLHLTSRDARDFMQITVPAGRTSNEFRDWDHQYLFYNNPAGLKLDPKTNAYQLFAVVLTFRGGEVVGDWRYLQNGFAAWVGQELRSQYGLPELIEDLRYDKLTRIVRQHFRHTFQGNNAVDYRHDIQVNAAMVFFGEREANLQLTYMTEHFNGEFLTSLQPGDYEVATTEWKKLVGNKQKPPIK
ncbi:MAG: hypothetical protein J0L75_15135 [Spirochaetes bacterium]|nr:hypothetical protein [Spirochaetota bacterium]